jgi:hypothetical protein
MPDRSVVRVHGAVDRGGQYVGNVHIGTLESRYRPLQNFAGMGCNKDGQDGDVTAIRVKTTGEIEVTAGGTTQDVYFDFTFRQV